MKDNDTWKASFCPVKTAIVSIKTLIFYTVKIFKTQITNIVIVIITSKRDEDYILQKTAAIAV